MESNFYQEGCGTSVRFPLPLLNMKFHTCGQNYRVLNFALDGSPTPIVSSSHAMTIFRKSE